MLTSYTSFVQFQPCQKPHGPTDFPVRSLPGLTRQSINLHESHFRRGWITGSSPVMTISNRMTDHAHHPNSYSAASNPAVIFQYSTSRHGVMANTRPFGLRYQLVMPLWVHTMRACMA